MIVFLLIGAVWFLWRRSKATGRPRDWLTVAGLYTWRPARRWVIVIAPVVGLVTETSPLSGPGAAVLLATATGTWAIRPTFHEDVARYWRRTRAADRFVKAVVETRCQADTRWLRCPHPLPKATTIDGPVARHEVLLPPGMDRDALVDHSGRLAAAMNVAAVTVTPHSTRPSGWCVVHVAAAPVVARRPLPVVEAPKEERWIDLGDGLHGPVRWDLDEEVGLAIYGAPGAGKGRLARWVALQWLDEQHGRELVVVDLQGSAEWRPLARHPRCRVLSFDPRDPVGSLVAIRQEIDRVAVAGAERMELCHLHGVDNWRALPDDIRALHPRRLVLVDEISNGLGKPPSTDKSEHAALVRALGPAIGKAYRTLRKTGVQCVHVDQLTYADTTTLPPGSTAMFGRWCALGGFGPDAREQISGTRDWPEDRAQAGLGVTGRRGAATIDVIGVPDVDRQAVDDTLDLATLPTTEAEATSVSPARQDGAGA